MPLGQVPKMLGALRQDWAPRAFVVSFKLETDDSILIAKAHALTALPACLPRSAHGKANSAGLLGQLRDPMCRSRMAGPRENRHELLRGQARAAIAKYGVHAVAANILDTRKEMVQLVQRGGEQDTVDSIMRGGSTVIEEPLVDRVVQLHKLHQSTEGAPMLL